MIKDQSNPTPTPAASTPTNTARPTQSFGRSTHPQRQKRSFQTGRPPVTKFTKAPTPSFARFKIDDRHLNGASPQSDGLKLRIAVIGGLEEIGRNCTMFEYGNDIILIDLGLQFPEEDMPGIDYIIPNMGYLKGQEMSAVLLSHMPTTTIRRHPPSYSMLGYPPIYGLPLTNAIIKNAKRITRAYVLLSLHNVGLKDKLILGSFEVEFSILTIIFPTPWV